MKLRTKRILFVTHASGLDLRSGGAVYTCNILRWLAGQKCDLGLLVLRPNASEPIILHFPWKLSRLRVRGGVSFRNRALRGSPADLAHALLKPFSRIWAARAHKAAELIFRPSPVPASSAWNRPLDDEERACIDQEVVSFEPDYILFNHYFMSDYRPKTAVRAQVGILTHELFFDRKHALESSSGKPVNWPHYEEAEEHRLLAQADHLLAINTRDADLMRTHFPSTRVDVAPIALKSAPLPLPASNDHILFIGGDAAHNTDAIQWLLTQIWPEIHRRRASARLVVCGKICEHIPVKNYAGVILRGVVEDLQAEYARTSFALIPLRVGSGLKTRILEAFSYGRGVVTTPVGLQGLEFVTTAAINAPTAADLVEQTLALLADPARVLAMSRAATQIIDQHFSSEATINALASSPLLAPRAA